MSKFLRTVDNINHFVGHTICYVLLFFAATGTYEVMARYIFNKPNIWIWEINGLLLCVITGLGAGFVLLNDIHIKVDLFYGYLSARNKAWMDVFSSFFMFLYLGVLLFQSGKMSLVSLKNWEASNTFFSPPLYPFKIILTLGIFLFLIQGIAGFIRNMYFACSGQKIGDNNDTPLLVENRLHSHTTLNTKQEKCQ